MTTPEERKKCVKEFEEMTERAEMRALSSASLVRPLTDEEYDRFMLLGKKYGILSEKVM
jgi:hypothetical protein